MKNGLKALSLLVVLGCFSVSSVTYASPYLNVTLDSCKTGLVQTIWLEGPDSKIVTYNNVPTQSGVNVSYQKDKEGKDTPMVNQITIDKKPPYLPLKNLMSIKVSGDKDRCTCRYQPKNTLKCVKPE